MNLGRSGRRMSDENHHHENLKPGGMVPGESPETGPGVPHETPPRLQGIRTDGLGSAMLDAFSDFWKG